ncbi:hypothetical protein JSY14_10385 [Brachybacterium sp. EF45031]|nr:hypothetical protein [Brachybacterium sillae]
MLGDPETAREAVTRRVRDYLEACRALDTGQMTAAAGEGPQEIARHPDFPTRLGMALVGAATLWGVLEPLPGLALRVAQDLAEDGEDGLAAGYAQLVRDLAVPGRHDAEAWTAQSLLMRLHQRSGSPAQADALARDLVAHGAPLDLDQRRDPSLPDDTLAWTGGALVEGMPPRTDGRALSVEDAQEHLRVLLSDTLREIQADEDPPR